MEVLPDQRGETKDLVTGMTAELPPVNPDEPFRHCSICQTLPEYVRVFWKGNELQTEPAPSAFYDFPTIGAPMFSANAGHTNHSLVQCPECETYYSWDFEYEFLVYGSEDELTISRLTPTDGRAKAFEVSNQVAAHKKDFYTKAPALLEKLNGPNPMGYIGDVVHYFYYEGLNKGCDIEFALPQLVLFLQHLNPKNFTAFDIRAMLRSVAKKNKEQRQWVESLLLDQDLDVNDPQIKKIFD